MGQSSTAYHEPVQSLSSETRDLHRAIVSLQEELEAVDWYNQRAEATAGELRQILLHNMGEEMEHACMLLEWVRRNHPTFDQHLRTYLFSEGSISGLEDTQSRESSTAVHNTESPGTKKQPAMTIGSLKGP